MKNIIALLSIIILLGNTLNAQIIDTLKANEFIEMAETSYNEQDYELTRDYCLQALEFNPNLGKAYIMIGMAYVQSSDTCSHDPFSKGIVFCLAVDKFEKAKEVDPSVTEEANQRIEVYSHYFPPQEIYVYIRKDAKVKVGCWINEETTYRYRENQDK